MDRKKVLLSCAALLFSLPQLFGQSGSVPFNGLVTDSAGEGVPRITVEVKGSGKRTSTDRRGRFGLTDVPPDAVLVLARRGEVWEIAVEGRRSLRVVLTTDGDAEAEESQELTDTGFGYVKRREYNYSTGAVTGEELRRSGQRDLESALAGRVAGVTRVNGELTIRGAGRRPLYLVDGMEASGLSSVNIDDVESVTVLKDGSMYGIRGAGGVISVKTRRGGGK